jgi:penicillin-binding protein A
MNRPIRKVAIALMLLLAAIFINMNVVQVADNNSYNDTGKYADNRLPILAQYSSPRGQIDAQGAALAKSRATNDELKYLRQYANGPVYAPVVGFDSIIYGTDGIEAAEDKVLSGSDPRQFGRKIADLFTGRNPTGGNVELTLSKAAQEAAYAAMKGPNGQLRRGAVVAIDPTTGRVLAAVSTPSYDPNKLSSHDTDGMQKYYAALQKDASQPMLNRALNQLYPPGSVFKVIVSAAALKDGVKPTDQVPAPNAYWPFGGRSGPCNGSTACIQNFGGETCQNGSTAQLIFAFAKSCNTAFAQLAVERLKGPAVAAEAQKFGFDGNQLSIPLPVTKSTVGSQADLADPGSLAHSSFGQQDVRMTPLQGAMIAAAVANGGRLMTPYLVQQELSSNFSVLSSTTPNQLAQVLDSTQNQQLEQMMEAVVTAPEGTGQAAQISDMAGVTVGGKTGTADTGIFHNGVQTPPHAWFCGFALANGVPKIAVAVVIENGGVSGDETTGGLAAAPVAKAVMEAYLKSPQSR